MGFRVQEMEGNLYAIVSATTVNDVIDDEHALHMLVSIEELA